MPGSDRAWPEVLSAIGAVRAGDGDGADMHMALGGQEAVRTLLVVAAVLLGRVCAAEDAGEPEELLADMREAVLRRDG